MAWLFLPEHAALQAVEGGRSDRYGVKPWPYAIRIALNALIK